MTQFILHFLIYFDKGFDQFITNMSRRRASTISGGFDVRKHKSGNKTPQLTFRIVVVGAPGVGKTGESINIYSYK